MPKRPKRLAVPSRRDVVRGGSPIPCYAFSIGALLSPRQNIQAGSLEQDACRGSQMATARPADRENLRTGHFARSCALKKSGDYPPLLWDIPQYPCRRCGHSGA
jgi:hypothetical protein